MRRIVTALVLIPPVLGVILLAPAWSFLLLAEAVALGAAHELFGLAERSGYRPFRLTGFLATALLAASFHPGLSDGHWTVLAVLVAVGLAAIRRGAPSRATLGEVSATLLGAVYVGLSAGSVVGLRYAVSDATGRSWIFFLLATTLLGDTGAYYTGLALGHRPLAPRISPKKTVEGLVAGLLTSGLVAGLSGPFLIPKLGPLYAAGLGIGLGLLGAAGDLFESLLKRSVGVKDSSSIVPGHGGILDRLDSVLFAAPGLWIYVRFLYYGH